MKRILARLVLLAGIVALSGCYYDPGYGYVRSSSYSGDVYYGQAAPVYQGGYYPYDYGYYGCCGVGIIGGWYGGYGGPRYYGGGRGYYPGRYGYGYGGGRWSGRGRPGYGGSRPGYGGHPGYGGGHGGGHYFSHGGGGGNHGGH